MATQADNFERRAADWLICSLAPIGIELHEKASDDGGVELSCGELRVELFRGIAELNAPDLYLGLEIDGFNGSEADLMESVAMAIAVYCNHPNERRSEGKSLLGRFAVWLSRKVSTDPLRIPTNLRRRYRFEYPRRKNTNG